MKRLSYSFYERHVVEVAKDLLGKTLVFSGFKGIVTETEAYGGGDDLASHAYKKTKRSEVMFGPAGKVYVYMIYGIYYCLNIVTESDGDPSAVLIRGVKLLNIHLNGPGKICKHLGINRNHNYIDLTTDKDFYLTEGRKIKYKATSRIGITKAIDKQWRFVIDDIFYFNTCSLN